MLENNTTPEPAMTPELTELHQLCEAELAELQRKLDTANTSSENWMKWHDKEHSTVNDAKAHIENAIQNGDISEDELAEPFWTELFGILGVETHEIVEVEVTATWTVSVTKPRGRALEAGDFSAELELSESDVDFDGYVPTPDMEISTY